jgi:hypothetical protein
MYGIHYFCNCYCLLYICRIDCYGYIDSTVCGELGELGRVGRLRLEFKFLEIIKRDPLQRIKSSSLEVDPIYQPPVVDSYVD